MSYKDNNCDQSNSNKLRVDNRFRREIPVQEGEKPRYRLSSKRKNLKIVAKKNGSKLFFMF